MTGLAGKARWVDGKRLCRFCDRYLWADNFHVRRASRDGLGNRCRACQSEYRRQQYERDPAKAKSQVAEWAAKNPEMRKRNIRKYEAANKEQRAAAASAHRARLKIEAPERLRQMSRLSAASRRKRLAGAAGKVSARWWRALFDIVETGVCMYCGTHGRKLVMDHFVPLAKGGPHAVGNLIPVCAPCNDSKGSKMPEDFLPPSKYEGAKMFLRCCAEAHAEEGGDA